MPRRRDDEQEQALPWEWLPEPALLEGSPEWEVMRAGVLAALEAPAREASWLSVMGSWWKPASVLAAAAAVALLLLMDTAPPRRSVQTADAGALTLGLLAADGHPAALMEELGIPADPVLALVAARGGAR